MQSRWGDRWLLGRSRRGGFHGNICNQRAWLWSVGDISPAIEAGWASSLRAPPTQARRQDKRAPSGPYHSTNKQKTLWGVGNKGQTIKEGNGWRYGYIHGDTWHNFCILYFIIYLCARLFNYGNSWMWANKDVSYHPTLVTSSPRGFWIKKLKEDFFYSWWRESVQKFRHWARVRTKQFWVNIDGDPSHINIIVALLSNNFEWMWQILSHF